MAARIDQATIQKETMSSAVSSASSGSSQPMRILWRASIAVPRPLSTSASARPSSRPNSEKTKLNASMGAPSPASALRHCGEKRESRGGLCLRCVATILHPGERRPAARGEI
jgi:hypothetical protein